MVADKLARRSILKLACCEGNGISCLTLFPYSLPPRVSKRVFQSELQILKMKRRGRERSRFHGHDLEHGEPGGLSFLAEKESTEFCTSRGKAYFYHGHRTYTNSLLLLPKMPYFKRPSETVVIVQVGCHTFNPRAWTVVAGEFLLVLCQPYRVRPCLKKKIIVWEMSKSVTFQINIPSPVAPFSGTSQIMFLSKPQFSPQRKKRIYSRIKFEWP